MDGYLTYLIKGNVETFLVFLIHCLKMVPLRCTSLKLSIFFFDLLFKNVSSICKVVPFDRTIMAFLKPSIISTGPDIVWTFSVWNATFEKSACNRV